LLLTVGADQAMAAGYAVGHESISGAGVAYAGGAAAASDASTINANPAGMTQLNGDQMVVGAHFIDPNIDFDDLGSVNFDGTPLTGGDGGDGAKKAAIPVFYYMWDMDNGVRLGLGVNAPYGLVTKYNSDWQGRYNEITTSLKTINVNPSAAYQVTDRLSVGGGFDLQYIRAKLLQALDFGAVCVGALGAPTCAAGFGLAPQASDGAGLVSGWDLAYGYNGGLLYELAEGTRIGVHYRSKIEYEIEVDAEFVVPAGARAFFTAVGAPTAFTDGGARVKLTIPETFSASIYHEIDPRWAVMADVTWTRWSQFEEVRVRFDNPATPANVLPTQWDDVFRVSAGVTYDWNDSLILRGGLAFDESPVGNAFRGPGIPDSDRYVIAVGFGYQLTESLLLDVAYQHLFLKEGSTARPSNTSSVLNGNFDVDIDVLSVGVNWKF
jgi:long-chain fatty acid transport protein